MFANEVNKHLGMDLLDRPGGFALLQEEQEVFIMSRYLMLHLIIMHRSYCLTEEDMARKPGRCLLHSKEHVGARQWRSSSQTHRPARRFHEADQGASGERNA